MKQKRVQKNPKTVTGKRLLVTGKKLKKQWPTDTRLKSKITSAKNLLAFFLPNLWWILSIWKLLDMKDGTPLLYYTFFWASSCIERSQKGKNYMVKGINRAKTLLLLGKIFTKWYHIECRMVWGLFQVSTSNLRHLFRFSASARFRFVFMWSQVKEASKKSALKENG